MDGDQQDITPIFSDARLNSRMKTQITHFRLAASVAIAIALLAIATLAIRKANHRQEASAPEPVTPVAMSMQAPPTCLSQGNGADAASAREQQRPGSEKLLAAGSGWAKIPGRGDKNP